MSKAPPIRDNSAGQTTKPATNFQIRSSYAGKGVKTASKSSAPKKSDSSKSSTSGKSSVEKSPLSGTSGAEKSAGKIIAEKSTKLTNENTPKTKEANIDKTIMSNSSKTNSSSSDTVKHSYSNGPIAANDTGALHPRFLLPEGAAYYILPADQIPQPEKKKSTVITMSELKLTGPAPNFCGTAVIDGDFKTISLSEYKGKYLVFFFYPLDFTFVCPTEIIAFSDRADEFRSLNCEVVACSTDSHFSHLAWVNTPRKQGGLGKMNIPLLADKNCDIATRYGVYKEDEGIAFRGLFIIDDKGILRQITINDLPVGRSVDETLRLVQAFQFTDKHGEVCPAGWKPGKETMKPNPTESKSFFQKNM